MLSKEGINTSRVRSHSRSQGPHAEQHHSRVVVKLGFVRRVMMGLTHPRRRVRKTMVTRNNRRRGRSSHRSNMTGRMLLMVLHKESGPAGRSAAAVKQQGDQEGSLLLVSDHLSRAKRGGCQVRKLGSRHCAGSPAEQTKAEVVPMAVVPTVVVVLMVVVKMQAIHRGWDLGVPVARLELEAQQAAAPPLLLLFQSGLAVSQHLQQEGSQAQAHPPALQR
jgi:hypothetical protein